MEELGSLAVSAKSRDGSNIRNMETRARHHPPSSVLQATRWTTQSSVLCNKRAAFSLDCGDSTADLSCKREKGEFDAVMRLERQSETFSPGQPPSSQYLGSRTRAPALNSDFSTRLAVQREDYFLRP